MAEEKRTIAYICPACKQSVILERSIFQLAAAPNELPCPCGKSALRVEMMGDRIEMGGLLGSAPVMPVHPESSADFIARGGRIPAPLHSLKN